MDVKKRAADFLKKKGMHYSSIDFDSTVEQFRAEMDRGLRGEESSLMMIPTFTTSDGPIKKEKNVIVVDAGGTNLRVALCRFDADGKFEILSFNKFSMPGADGPVSVEEFFDGIARHIAPIADKSDTVGFCFSFAVEMLPNRDGRIIALAKEIEVENSEGVLVCESLAEAMVRQGVVGPKRYVLLNDTVAAMMGAKATAGKDCYNDYAGFILGTGTNICYAEPCANITKSEYAVSQSGSMIINIETGGFDKLSTGEIDRLLDEQSAKPGTFIAEKMMAGRYLGETMFMLLKAAASERLLSVDTAKAVAAAEQPELRRISEFYRREQGSGLDELFFNEDDAEFFREIVGCMFERSAKIAAIQLGAIFSRAGQGTSAQHPVCVCAEGTTLYKSPLLLDSLKKFIEQDLNGRLGVYVDLVSVTDATVVGSALAALLNT